MISHGQFVQDIGVLDLMYQAFGDTRKRRATMHRHWYAVMTEGSVDQIRITQAEMHQYLRLAYPLPESPPPDTDPPPHVVSADDFRIALDSFLQMYRGLGEMRHTFGQYRPGLYTALAAQVLPHLYAVQSALHAYLGWEDVERTMEEMERQFGSEPVNGPPPGAELTPAAEHQP